MSQPNEEEKLSGYMLFRSLAPAEAGALSEFVEEVEFLAGEHLCHEGEPGQTLYIIQEGKVEIRKKGKDGAEQLLATLGQYSMIGEMALLTDSPRSASALATELTKAYKIQKKTLHEKLKDGSIPAYKVTYAMARVLAHRLEKLDETMASLLEIHAESEALQELKRQQEKLAMSNPLLEDEEGELY